MSRYKLRTTDGTGLVMDKDGDLMYVSDHNKLMAQSAAKVQELATQLEWAKKGKEISQADLDAAKKSYEVTQERWKYALLLLTELVEEKGYQDDMNLIAVEAWLAEVKRKP